MIYEIKKGMHYSWGLNFSPFIRNRKKDFSFECEFLEGFKYDHGDADQLDINKLFGYSQGLFHHEDSIRIGWRWNKERKAIQILAYAYTNGKRVIKPIFYVDGHTKLKVKIKEMETFYKIIASNGKFQFAVSILKENKKNSFIKFTLFPYFGGDKSNPNNTKIKIVKT